RLLKDKISTHVTLYRWNPRLWDTPLCQVCSSAHESCSHFFVYCPVKWPFWRQTLQLLNPVSSFSDDDIWAALSTLHDLQSRPYLTDILVSIGTILDTVWRYHWQCHFEQTTWSDTAAINLLLSSVTFQLSTE
ncbi:MAG: hypothetical protein EXX96DRAFT_487984, partial [Benjaminiella poitrasii]